MPLAAALSDRKTVATARTVDAGNSLQASNATRCFVFDGATDGVSPDLIGRVEHEDEPFDVFLDLSASADPKNDKIAAIIARCSNPAAPLISASQSFGARADLVLSEVGPSSIMSALMLAQPLIKRVSQLPPILPGPDRNRLLALTLAFTRDTGLEAKWAPHSQRMVEYPLLAGVPNQLQLLEELANSGFLARRYGERLFICSTCQSSRLLAREVCNKCHSSHIEEQPLLHHYLCGFQGMQSLFQKPDGYRCPKCAKALRHYGVDYDRPGAVFECRECSDVTSEPDVHFVCADCNHSQPSDGTARVTWSHYDLTSDGVAVVQSGTLGRRDPGDAGKPDRPIREFLTLAGQALAVSVRHTRPIAAFRLTVDMPELSKTLGAGRLAEFRSFLLELAAQGLADGDLIAPVQDGLVGCLPECDQRRARSVIAQIEQSITRKVRSKIALRFNVQYGEAVGALLEGIR